MQKIVLFFFFTAHFVFSGCQSSPPVGKEIITGAQRTDSYFNYLKDKSVALVCNHSSMIYSVHLLDTLIHSGIQVVKVFTPEHGLRGNEDAGKGITDSVDNETGIPVISLYGKKKKPAKGDMEGIDIVVFDIQDVGVRFYTYISTMHYVMEACADNDIQLILLDRPNPNGFYVDGPILLQKYKSFSGMHPVPVVHGLTIGEFALMINGEGWLTEHIKCKLTVIPCLNYTHNTRFMLHGNPSPNLRNMSAVYLYPSLGLFEGTVMSIGRGTPYPFQVIGHPDFPVKNFSFKPVSSIGAKSPKYEDKICYRYDLTGMNQDSLAGLNKIDISQLIRTYDQMALGEKFFTNYFNYLAGNDLLKNQIMQGLSEKEIRKSWQPGIDHYKQIRMKYLLYTDFE